MMKNKDLPQVYLPDAASWRKWLFENHSTSRGVWLIYFKKHTGKPRIPYGKAVEEALCFGWIDSTIRRIDDERYMQKFTPRRPGSSWSELNKKRVESLTAEGRMTPAGKRSVREARAKGKWDELTNAKKEFAFSEEVLSLLGSSPVAGQAYASLAPSLQRQCRQWIMSARKPETRLKRCREMISLLEKGEQLGMK